MDNTVERADQGGNLPSLNDFGSLTLTSALAASTSSDTALHSGTFDNTVDTMVNCDTPQTPLATPDSWDSSGPSYIDVWRAYGNTCSVS